MEHGDIRLENLGDIENRNVGDRKPEKFWGNSWRKKCGVYLYVLNTMYA